MYRKISRLSAIAVFAGLVSLTGNAQSVTYKLVPDWPKMPAGMHFGLKEPPPLPEERENRRIQVFDRNLSYIKFVTEVSKPTSASRPR